MILEEALEQVTKALAPEFLSPVQLDVFQQAWNKQSYHKMSRELNYEYSYIKDVGAELWQLLTKALQIQVTKLNLQEALTQYAQQKQVFHPSASTQFIDWGEAPDVSQFCGRQAQLTLLERWVIQNQCRLVVIVGMGGIGKTMLVTQFAQQLAETDQFEVIVWRSLRQAPPLVDLLIELISAISTKRNSKATTPEPSRPQRLDHTMRQLLEQLRTHRCLLILDNVEAVFSSNELAGTYRSGYEDYGWLFEHLGGRHQSSVLLTSREVPAEIARREAPIARVRLLRLGSLLIEEGERILAAKGLAFQSQQPQVRELIERYQGNPLALEIVATRLKDLFDGNIAAFWAQETLLFKDIRDLLTQQFDRLSALERQVMYWLAIDREAVSAAQLQSDLLPSVSQAELRDALVSLDQRSLIEKAKPTLIETIKPATKPTAFTTLNTVRHTQQPVVMEYVTEQLINQVCQEVEQVQIECLRTHALLKAQAKDTVRLAQIQLIVQPILARLEAQSGSTNLQHLLLQLLRVQQHRAPLQPGYLAGNVIKLLCQLGVELNDLDFSDLTIWQADLRMMNLQGTKAKANNFVATTLKIQSH